MFKQKEQKKSKFKKCPVCKTETVLAICPFCKRQLSTVQFAGAEIVTATDVKEKRRLRRLAKKENAKKEK